MENYEILKTISGEKINNTDEWETFRRNEIITLFSNYVYGVRDSWSPEKLDYCVMEQEHNYQNKNIFYKAVKLYKDNFDFNIKMFLPESDKPVPVFVYIMHEFESNEADFEKELNYKCVPVEDIISRGYGVVVMPTEKVYPDWKHKSGYKDGVFSLMPENEKRRRNSWATISAWAWGAQRVMDYLQTDELIDKNNIAVAGHSRGGKTALWCGAEDQRYSFVISNNSGCMGASILKGKTGEHIKDINITDWFCEKFHDFNDREEFLPVDQHMLLALIAPRLLYVTSSEEDSWADPANEFKACVEASCVYEMYNIKGVVMEDEKPNVNCSYHEGNIGYHMKNGEHSITPFDWKNFMDFWDIHKK